MIQNLQELKKNPKIRIRSIQDKYYMFGLEKCFELNELGAIVIKYVGKDMSIDELCEAISKKYDESDTSIIKRDITQFIEFLIEEKMIEYE